MKKINKISIKGFTIAELMISMGIFIVAISITTTVFIRALKVQREIVAYAEVNDALQLSIEQIAREIRTGHNFRVLSAGKDLTFQSAQERESQESSGITFPIPPKRFDDPDVSYRLNADQIARQVPGLSPASPLPITPENIIISDLKFVKTNENPDLIKIILTAKPATPNLSGDYEITIQTSVSPRGI